MIAESPKMKPILQLMERIGPSDANVLITGEHGTGKELVAQWLHASSPRSARSFIAVNMGGLSEGVFESELFGHVKGAFTDAKTDRVGRFELADGGTIFLDEIGTVSLALQSKLLRVLQTGDVERVGSSKARHVDVRVVSATNANLQHGSGRGALPRGSALPAQHDRDPSAAAARPARGHPAAGDALPAASRGALQKAAHRLRRRRRCRRCSAHSWPGNIRELDHAIERAVLLAQGEQVRAGDLGLRGVDERGAAPRGSAARGC